MSRKGCADLESRSPALHIVRGKPSDEELAALTVVLAKMSTAAATPAHPAGARSAWADPAYRLRIPLHRGPGAWRTSLRPH